MNKPTDTQHLLEDLRQCRLGRMSDRATVLTQVADQIDLLLKRAMTQAAIEDGVRVIEQRLRDQIAWIRQDVKAFR